MYYCDNKSYQFEFVFKRVNKLQNIPYFGEYQKLREKKIAELKEKMNPLDVNFSSTRPAPEPVGSVPAIKDVIGKSLSHIGTYKELNNKQQVVALIDDVCN